MSKIPSGLLISVERLLPGFPDASPNNCNRPRRLLSPEHKTSAKTHFLFEKMQLRSWTLKLKTYVSATKCGRMKRLENNEKRPFLSLSGKSPSQRNPEKLKRNMVFQACFDCNSPVRHGKIYPASPNGRIAFQRPQICHFLTSTETLTWTSTERSKNRLGH